MTVHNPLYSIYMFGYKKIIERGFLRIITPFKKVFQD
jgi:hypothetical protein